jgi:hypothetical protein
MIHPRQIALAAAAYWELVFAGAFALGVIRTVWLVPRIGELAAVACEVPLVLTLSWWAAQRITARWGIAGGGAALVMGLIAFTILMLAELALAQLLTGQSPQQWAAGLMTPAGALGLAGQVLFALMPWWVVQRRMRQ